MPVDAVEDVIGHIKKDHLFIQEVKRILKPGGKLIIATPNILMSLTRNPWHVREYTPAQFDTLLSRYFRSVEKVGGDVKQVETVVFHRSQIIVVLGDVLYQPFCPYSNPAPTRPALPGPSVY